MWPLSGKQIFELVYDTPCEKPMLNQININGIITDSRQIAKHTILDSKHSGDKVPFLFVAIQGEKFDGHAYLKMCFEQGVSLALVNKHSSYIKELTSEHLERCLFVEDVILSVRELAKKFRQTFSFPVVGIGGSNGKTTTKEILFSFLSYDGHKITKTQKSENGFLGIALTLLQREHRNAQPPQALVLEIGIDSIGAMEKHVQIAKPNVVLLTALGPEHLTGLKNWDTAAQEECLLFETPDCIRVWQMSDQKIYEHFLNVIAGSHELDHLKNDYFVFDTTSEKFEEIFKAFSSVPALRTLKSGQTLFWTIQDLTPQNLKIKLSSDKNFANILMSDTIPLSGKHNAANFAVAFGAARAVGLKAENILEGFQTFTPPPQRSHLFSLPEDTILFDDTYNASPASVLAALDVLQLEQWRQKKKVIVLGDMLELGDESDFWHENLFPHLRGLSDTHLCLFGSAMYNCYKLFKEIDADFFHKQRLSVDWLAADQNPAGFFESLSQGIKGSVILVKGSRGMQLERFVHCVEKFFS